MARTLNVYFDRELVGRLTQDDSGRLGFQYQDAYRSKPDALALSRSLPLRAEPFTQNECRGFFGGTLPELTPVHVDQGDCLAAAGSDRLAQDIRPPPA